MLTWVVLVSIRLPEPAALLVAPYLVITTLVAIVGMKLFRKRDNEKVCACHYAELPRGRSRTNACERGFLA